MDKRAKYYTLIVKSEALFVNLYKNVTHLLLS